VFKNTKVSMIYKQYTGITVEIASMHHILQIASTLNHTTFLSQFVPLKGVT